MGRKGGTDRFSRKGCASKFASVSCGWDQVWVRLDELVVRNVIYIEEEDDAEH